MPLRECLRHLLAMLTCVMSHDGRQCEILTLHAGEQWRGAGSALVEAAGQLAALTQRTWKGGGGAFVCRQLS